MCPSSRGPLLQKGDLLGGKWEIREHIATGGEGQVYRDRQVNLDREVAVKIVSQEGIRAEMECFRREVLAMARARQVNVLQVYDFESVTIPEEGLRGEAEGFLRWIRRCFLPILDGVEHIIARGSYTAT